jgi:hypothetical protein
MDELRQNLIDRLKRDSATLRQGVEWMESATLKTEDVKDGWLHDRTNETLVSYRELVAGLERQLEAIERDPT